MPKINNSLLKSIGYFLIGKVFNLTEKPVRLGNIADPVESFEAANLQTVLSQTNHVVENYRLVDSESLLSAVLADPFVVNDWKSSFSIVVPSGDVINGVFESSGDFSSEESYQNLLGISPVSDSLKESSFMSATFLPTGGQLLGAISESYIIKTGGADNFEITYLYEENSSATDANPKYVHDFRITVNSTQILGYVIINADDSESHNFIVDSAGA